MIWRSSYHKRVAQFADFLTAEFSILISYYVWGFLHVLFPGNIPEVNAVTYKMTEFFVTIGIIVVMIFNYFQAYSYQRFTSLKKEFLIILKVSLSALVLIIAGLFFMGYRFLPRTIFLLSFSLSIGFFLAQKTALFYVAREIRKKGKNRKRVLLLGTGHRAEQFVFTVRKNFSWGLDIVAALSVEEQKVGGEICGIKIIGTINDIESFLKELNPEEVIVAFSTKRFDQFSSVVEACEREGIVVRLKSDFFGRVTKDVRIHNVYGLKLISLNMLNQTEFELMIKRIIDIVGSLVGLALFAPFILVASIWILIVDGWPIFYTYEVVGQNRRRITLAKIRTMVKNAEKLKSKYLDKNEMDGPVFKIARDPRILPSLQWVRKFSIDETPQLLSVLKGDLSLVGPRPPGPHEFAKFESWHRRKACIKPGLTCLWQVNGRANISNFDEWIKLDLRYIDTWSLWLDIKILLKTIPAVAFGRGAS